jgi:outer membrane protein
MMKKTALLIILSAISFGLTSAQVEEPWSLEKCINYALENNIQVKRQELQSELTEKDYTQSYFNFTPTLNAGLEHSLSNGRALNTELYRWENAQQTFGSMGVRSELTLFNGLQNLNTVKLLKYSFLSSKEDLEKTKNDISLQIMNYYLQVLFDEELLNVSKSQYEVTLLQVEKTKRLVEVGNVAMGQLYEIQAQAATEKLNFTVNRNKLQLSVLDLVQLLDLDSVGNFTVYHPVSLSVENTLLPASFEDAIANALINMPEIRGAEYRVKSSEKNLSVRRGMRSPEVYLSGVYYSRYQNGSYNPNDSTYTYPLIDQLKDKQYSQITLGVSIPIFNRFQTQTAISKAKISLADSKLQLDQEKQVLYKRIQQAHTDALGAFEKYQSALEAVKSNEEAFNYTQQKYEVGLVNAVDFSISKNNYSKARSDLAQAKYEYIFKVKILDFYTGKEIQL